MTDAEIDSMFEQMTDAECRDFAKVSYKAAAGMIVVFDKLATRFDSFAKQFDAAGSECRRDFNRIIGDLTKSLKQQRRAAR